MESNICSWHEWCWRFNLYGKFVLFFPKLVINVLKYYFLLNCLLLWLEEHILQVLQNMVCSKVVEEYETGLRAGRGVHNGKI